MARPMLDGVELQQVQDIEVEGDQVLAQHGVPALEGDFLQGLGRRATQVTLTGVLTGPEVGDGLKTLREKFRAAAPVPFVADITTATKVDQVLIEEMGVRELAGKPERFEYALTLREFILPPAVEAEEPPEPDVPPPPDDDIDQNVGTLEVEVIVEGDPNFDFSRVTVSVEGTQEDGTSLSRTLTNRENNIWTDENMPAGEYTARAVVTDPPPMAGSASATVRAGQTTRVTIRLRAGAVIATAFVVHFRFDKAFVEPCMRHVMRQVAQYASDHPDEKLVIVGHTDRVGDDEPNPGPFLYNQSLSERRARSAYAYLTFGRDRTGALAEWNELRQRRPIGVKRTLHDTWGTHEYQYMLQDLGYYPGNIDGDHGPLTNDAVRTFRADKGLPSGTTVDDAVWEALIDAYLSQDSLAIPESQFLPNCDGEILKWLGCGEQDPVRNTQDAWRPNRRVELLFVRADALPCPVPQPDTFDLPSPGTVNKAWCLGPGDPDKRCCFITRDTEQPDKWLVQPAEPGTVTVRGSIKFENGTPAANVKYVLIAPDGEFLHKSASGTPDLGEVPRRDTRGRPVTPRNRTDANGEFSYPPQTFAGRQTTTGVYTLEIEEPLVARLAEDPPGAAKGNVVCKRLDGNSAFEVIVAPAELGDPRRKLRATTFDRFGRPRRRTEIEVIFNDGTRVTTTSNDTGEFVIEMERPQEVGKIRYNLTDEEPVDIVFFEEFFIDVKSINTDEGVRRRLHNLGYLVGDDLGRALLAFQAAQGLDTTGEIDDATRTGLGAVYDGDAPLTPEFVSRDTPIGPDELDEAGPPV